MGKGGNGHPLRGVCWLRGRWPGGRPGSVLSQRALGGFSLLAQAPASQAGVPVNSPSHGLGGARPWQLPASSSSCLTPRQHPLPKKQARRLSGWRTNRGWLVRKRTSGTPAQMHGPLGDDWRVFGGFVFSVFFPDWTLLSIRCHVSVRPPQQPALSCPSRLIP